MRYLMEAALLSVSCWEGVAGRRPCSAGPGVAGRSFSTSAFRPLGVLQPVQVGQLEGEDGLTGPRLSAHLQCVLRAYQLWLEEGSVHPIYVPPG